MNFWIYLWTGVFVFGIAVFFCMAVIVSIRGLLDIFSLFRSLREQHKEK